MRIKWRPHVRTNPNVLRDNWVPIERRSCNINVTRLVRCKRRQFPIVPARALTIHKSQGGTFQQIVYQYSREHKQQLVYVAMSRVTSLEGLYLTDASEDHRFYHARGTTTPSVKETRDEYLRLTNHRLDTATNRIPRLLDTAGQPPGACIVANLNAQSLRVHAEDISTDAQLTRSDILIVTETWMVRE
jgi:hypothetical protein